MLFHYKATNRDGQPIDGTLEAKDKFALYSALKKDGNNVISAVEIEKSKFSFVKLLSFLGGVGSHDKIIFARNLGQMIEAGLPITRAISIMEKQTSTGKYKTVLQKLNESITKGVSLSDAMKDHPDVFNSLFVSMTKAGEESGNLSASLKNIASQLEKSYQLTKKIRGALIYPAVIFSLMIVIGVLMMVYMVPTITSTFTGLGLELPLSTRIIISTSNFLQSYFALVVLALIILVFSTIVALRTEKGKRFSDIVISKIPIISEMVRQVNSARTTRAMSSLISAGVDIVLAIEITKEVVQNSFYKEILDKIKVSIQKGEPISGVFIANQNLYPLFVGEMVAVGEETGKIADMLQNVADYYEEEVDQKTKDISSVIEPFLMIFIGVSVGFFALAIIGPMYSLADSIQ